MASPRCTMPRNNNSFIFHPPIFCKNIQYCPNISNCIVDSMFMDYTNLHIVPTSSCINITICNLCLSNSN